MSKLKSKKSYDNTNRFVFPFLSFSAQFSLGVSHTGSGIRHALICRDPRGHESLISSGTGIPFWLKLFSPLTVYTDTGLWPTVIKTEDIGNQDPEIWIDKHEEFLVPQGMKSDQITSDYVLLDTTLCSAAISQNGLEQFMAQLDSALIPKSITAPLFSLAKLYSRNLNSDFILWKLTSTGSIFGLVQKGILRETLNFWPSVDQIANEDETAAAQISEMLHTFSKAGNEIPVVLYCPEDKFKLPESFTLPQFEIKSPPEIKHIPEKDHEAYALTLETEGPDLTPFNEAVRARRTSSTKIRCWKSVWSVSISLFTVLFLLAIAKLGFYINQSSGSYDRQDAFRQIQKLEMQTVKYDSLKIGYSDKAQIFKAKSRTTLLLSQLQGVFPEGVWAEEITVSETGLHTYSMKIRALTYSSSSISQFLENLGKIRGTSEVRIAYSENTKVHRKKAIRFLTECNWEDK